MRLLKLVSLVALIFSLVGACNKKEVVIMNASNTMSGNQEVPAKPGAWNGTIDYSYNKFNHTLTYTIKWNSLSTPIVGAHIHGLAGKGMNAGVVQDFTSAISKAQAGTYSGSLFVDGVVVKEEDLLLGRFYANIHTQTNPGGEIRGQIEFPK